jgi:ribosomal protein L30E
MKLDEASLLKEIREAARDKRVILGSKEVLHYLSSKKSSRRNVKLVVLSRGCKPHLREALAKVLSTRVPAYALEKSSTGLGKICGKPFKVSMAAILKRRY